MVKIRKKNLRLEFVKNNEYIYKIILLLKIKYYDQDLLSRFKFIFIFISKFEITNINLKLWN
jgi:hypothetical protein